MTDSFYSVLFNMNAYNKPWASIFDDADESMGNSEMCEVDSIDGLLSTLILPEVVNENSLAEVSYR